MEESIRQNLFDNAMKGQWDVVEDIYKENPWAHTVSITPARDTALHLAILDGQEDTVKKLVGHIKGTTSDHLPALETANKQGNTPLHLAAKVGSARMCHCIAARENALADRRNDDGENPIFTAVLHGKTNAYRALVCFPGCWEYGTSRKAGGDTILHAAISGEYFDLAFEIIGHYRHLINYVNGRGEFPLHVLATKPFAFRSGNHLNWFNKIIYNCIWVEKLPTPLPIAEAARSTADEKSGETGKRDEHHFPDNYQTCFMLPKLMIDTAQNIMYIYGKAKSSNGQKDTKDPNVDMANSSDGQKDIEDPNVDMAKSSDGQKDIEDPKVDMAKSSDGQKDIEDPNVDMAKSSDGRKDIEDPNVDMGPHPPNWNVIFEYIKLTYKVMLVILGKGSRDIEKMEEKKKKHTWSVQIIEELLKDRSSHDLQSQYAGAMLQERGKPAEESPFSSLMVQKDQDSNVGSSTQVQETAQENGGKNETTIVISRKNGGASEVVSVDKIRELFPVGVYDKKQGKSVVLLAEENKQTQQKGTETPILVAAKNGITEIIERLLDKFPVAIHDTDAEEKNIVHLAVEHRQPHVFNLLLMKRETLKEAVFGKLDKNGNSALHLAARVRDYRAWNIPGEALQLQWELKWYQYVKFSMPLHFFVRYNKEGKTPKDIFRESHKDQIKEGREWLNHTSNSCSVVAALIATVAFATSATFPGGVNDNNGRPTLEHQPAFNIFAISSLVALCSSVTALVMFLSILTSRHQAKDFGRNTPRMLLMGLTSLFVSIAAVLLSFCAGHFFVLEDNLRFAAIPVYAVTCLPVTLFAMAQFPLYFDLLTSTFRAVPLRSAKPVP